MLDQRNFSFPYRSGFLIVPDRGYFQGSTINIGRLEKFEKCSLCKGLLRKLAPEKKGIRARSNTLKQEKRENPKTPKPANSGLCAVKSLLTANESDSVAVGRHPASKRIRNARNYPQWLVTSPLRCHRFVFQLSPPTRVRINFCGKMRKDWVEPQFASAQRIKRIARWRFRRRRQDRLAAEPSMHSVVQSRP